MLNLSDKTDEDLLAESFGYFDADHSGFPTLPTPAVAQVAHDIWTSTSPTQPNAMGRIRAELVARRRAGVPLETLRVACETLVDLANQALAEEDQTRSDLS